MIKYWHQQISSDQHGSEKLIRQSIEKIKTYRENAGKAYISLDEDLAIAAAQSADLARPYAYQPSLLAGLAVSIKDLFDVKNQVTASASKVLAQQAAATQDAEAVRRLRQAGAVLLGRTNMSEFAFSGLGLNPHYGTPTYADGFKRIAGGSTSGGAVSVALGHSVAALGSDTGGSLRIPAAFCGLVGFKPSSGRIPTTGAFPLSYAFDTIGSITHTVEDNIIVDEVLSGEKFQHRAVQLDQLHRAISDDYFLDDADAEVVQAYQKTLEVLAAHGVKLHKVDLSALYEIPKINHAGGLTAAEAWFIHRDLLSDSEKYNLYDPRVAQRIVRGQKIIAADYLHILQQRKDLIERVSKTLYGFDALLYPTVAIVPPLLEPLEKDQDLFFSTNALVLRNTTVMNFLDGCALSLPCQQDQQLPVGLTIAGLHGQDQHILNISLCIEELLGQGN